MPRAKYPLSPFGRAVKKRMVNLDPDMIMDDLVKKLGIRPARIQEALRLRYVDCNSLTPNQRRIMEFLGLTVEDIEREEKMVG